MSLFGLIIGFLFVIVAFLSWTGQFSREKDERDSDWWAGIFMVPFFILCFFGLLIFSLMS